MASLVRLCGVILVCLVAYHYINEPLWFNHSGSVATVIFGICLIVVYQGYHPDIGNWIGWCLLGVGCVLLSLIDELSWLLLIPIILIIIGYRLTALPFELGIGGFVDGSDGGSGIDGGGCGGGDGGCG